jgi:hypothetical protein
MSANQIKKILTDNTKKIRKSKKPATPVTPDELISEINQQSTALQKIVSRFLEPVVGKSHPKNNE